jgi:hypothetical protein
MKRAMAVHYDPKLMEEAVFHVQRDSYVARELDERRRRIYEISEPEERERLFQDLYREWFVRLGLGDAIEQALQELPIISALVNDCYIACATQAKQEGAELFVAPKDASEKSQRRTLRILIRPESLLERETAITFLRYELYHIADMLDPAFAYHPTLPSTDGGPTYDTLVTNRYRVLWSITISGRMMRRGWLTQTTRSQALKDFCQAFPMLQDGAEKYFELFFDADQPRHSTLAAYAVNPRAAVGQLDYRSVAGTHCPLCRFPSHCFEPDPEKMAAEVLAAIAQDFPGWSPARGLCAQCADLYRASRLSMAAAEALPGWNPKSSMHPDHEREINRTVRSQSS